MKILENDYLKAVIDGGRIVELYDKNEKTKTNLADAKKTCGSVGYTLKSEDIKAQNPDSYRLFDDKQSNCSKECLCGEKIGFKDEEADIYTEFSTDDDGIIIKASSDNDEISQFALNLDLNFLGKKGTYFKEQIIPSSTYSSENNEYSYCIMPRPNGRVLLLVVLKGFKGFKLGYSQYCFGHFIQRYQVIASYDRAFNAEDKKEIEVKLIPTDSVEKAFETVRNIFKVPVCKPFVSGNYGSKAVVECSEDTEKITVTSPSGEIYDIFTENEKYVEINTKEEGFYKVVPFNGEGKSGMDTVVWHCGDMREAFDRCSAAISGPEIMDNSCEGGVYIWSKLCNMRTGGHKNFEKEVLKGFERIIGKNENPNVGASILPFADGENFAYHLYGSDRVQNDFFICSYLLEAYRTFNDRYYLEYAVSIMIYLIGNRIKDGCITSNYSAHSDYTTVCCPIINIIDLMNELKSLSDERYLIMEKASTEICEHLMNRGWLFPTECSKSDETEFETEDGSVSCTALTLLYYCANVKFVKEYFLRAKEILLVHNAWTIYSPDVRMYRSSFRWWETIWEGDKHGPTVNAGHAWTVWRAEALYYLGILGHDEEAMLESWNSYMTNYCKMTENGEMYACFEPDYIVSTRMSDNDYQPWHRYPENTDTSLSNYVWTRSVATWLKTALFTQKEGKEIALNTKKQKDGYILGKDITTCFIGEFEGELTLKTDNNINFVLKGKKAAVKRGYNPYFTENNLFITPENSVITVEFAK